MNTNYYPLYQFRMMMRVDDPVDVQTCKFSELPCLSYQPYLEKFFAMNNMSINPTIRSSYIHDLIMTKSDEFKQAFMGQAVIEQQLHQKTLLTVQKEVEQQQSQLSSFCKYYSKNACKNIVKKSLRAIQQGTYKEQICQLCIQEGISYEYFSSQILKSLQKVTGPSALLRLIKQGPVGSVFRKYLRWYIDERYIREALKAGHMKDLKVYVEYKNKQLVALLRG